MSKPIDVLFTQRILKVSGFDPHGLDGRWGKNTEAASAAFDAKYEEIATAMGRFDPRTEGNIHTLVPKAQVATRTFMNAAKKAPFVVKILSGTRTYAEQDALFNQRPQVTRARGGQSNHNFGIAWDVGIFVNGDYYEGGNAKEEQAYKDLSVIAKAALALSVPGIEWGGDWHSFKDLPHYQLATGKSVSDVAHLLESGTAYV